MNDLSHVIATRLNIGRGLNGNWTRKRIDLMVKYCAPSVFAQNYSPVLWIILVDVLTPKAVREAILRRTTGIRGSRFDVSVNVVTMPPKNWGPVFGKWCQKVIDTEWVATTRLDSDDALHADYLKDINDAAREKTEVLSFKGGFILQLPERTIHQLMRTDTNFQTLVEPTAKAKGAYCVKHGKLKNRFPFRVIDEYPRWLVLRHDDNWHYDRKRKGACKFTPVPVSVFENCFGFLKDI